MTPEQIISELRFAADTGGADPSMLREAADLIASLDGRWEHSDHTAAKYYRKMREAQRELEERELHHFETEQAITHALALDAQHSDRNQMSDDVRSVLEVAIGGAE